MFQRSSLDDDVTCCISSLLKMAARSFGTMFNFILACSRADWMMVCDSSMFGSQMKSNSFVFWPNFNLIRMFFMWPWSARLDKILWSDFLSIFPSNPSFFSLSAINLYSLVGSSITLYKRTASRIVLERRRRRTWRNVSILKIFKFEQKTRKRERKKWMVWETKS